MSTTENFHAGSRPSQEYLYDIDVPTPKHAERAKTMATGITSGALSTFSTPEAVSPGYPYGSLVTTVLHEGNPVFLISGLAVHTKNLRHDVRCSLMLTETGEDNPLALGRITLVGECAETDDESAKRAYLDAHPDAKYYLNYGDFAFWRLQLRSLRYIGGFGRMSWVDIDDWFDAEPDPLASVAAGIITHMNDDHTQAMSDYCRAFSKAQNFSDVKMTSVDRYGFEMSVKTPDGWRPVRLAFESPLSTQVQVREAMVLMVKRARDVLANCSSARRSS